MIDKQNIDAMYHKSQSLAQIGKHKQAISLLRKIAKKEKSMTMITNITMFMTIKHMSIKKKFYKMFILQKNAK